MSQETLFPAAAHVPNDLRLRVVKGHAETVAFRSLIRDHHSYTPSSRIVGKTLNFLIEVDGLAIGAIGLQSPMIPLPKVLDAYLGFNTKQQIADYTDIKIDVAANNWRFTLGPNASKNDGSKSLGLLERTAPPLWKALTGEELRFLYTYVGAGKTGAVYKATNWENIGTTMGWVYEGGTSNKDYHHKHIEEQNKKLIFVKKVRRIKAVSQTGEPTA